MAKKATIKKNIPKPDKTLLGILSSGFYPYLIMTLLPLVVFMKVGSFQFSYFDDKIIFDNLSKIISQGFWQAIFHRDAFFSGTGMPFYRPLQNFTFVIDYFISGNSPGTPHVTNLFIHILTCFAIFNFLKKIKISNYQSFLLTLLFSVNPLLCQTICWIPSRGDLLLGLTGVLYFIALIKYFENHSPISMLVLALTGLLAIFAKETAIMLPVIGFIIIYTTRKEIYSKKYLVYALVIFGAEFLIYFLLRGSAVTYSFANSNISFMNLIANLRTMPELTAKFIYPADLSPIPSFEISIFIPGIILLFGGAFALFLSKDHDYNYAVAGFAIFVLAILPTLIYSNPNPDTTYDYLEHRAYLPVIGFLLIIVELVRHFKLTKYFLLITVLIAVYSGFSFYYANTYKEPKEFFGRAIMENSSCALAYYNYGVFLRDEGFKKIAMYNFNQAISYNPNYSDAYFDRANLYQDANNIENALRDYNKAIQTNSSNAKAYNNRGILNGSENKFTAALDDFNHAIAANPNFAEAYSNRGLALMNLQRYQESIADFNKSIEIDPANPNPYFNRALVEQITNNMIQACADWQKAYNLGHAGAKAYIDKYCR